MTVQRDNLDVVSGAEVVEAAESVLEGTPVVEPVPVEPAPPTEVPVVPPVKKDDPEVTPMCCGGMPGHGFVRPLEFVHAPDCPNAKAD
ncbi:hypothetical protein ABZX92_45550 [Lentzea sp. NPDC006480]|uniref:hypothetical protein n=1 Tax=Lentzea sp. NPDC006480 TaxID=3157176 RepID=UPI0033B361D1